MQLKIQAANEFKKIQVCAFKEEKEESNLCTGFRYFDVITRLSFSDKMSRVMRKCVLFNMRTTNAQISLRIRAV